MFIAQFASIKRAIAGKIGVNSLNRAKTNCICIDAQLYSHVCKYDLKDREYIRCSQRGAVQEMAFSPALGFIH